MTARNHHTAAAIRAARGRTAAGKVPMRALFNLIESLRGVAANITLDLHRPDLAIAHEARELAESMPALWVPYSGDSIAGGWITISVVLSEHPEQYVGVGIAVHHMPPPNGWTKVDMIVRSQAQLAAGRIVLARAEAAAVASEARHATVIAAIERSHVPGPRPGWEDRVIEIAAVSDSGVFAGEGG